MISSENRTSPLRLEDWGLVDYQEAFERQAEMVERYLRGAAVDTLVLVEHPAIITLGRRGSEADLRFAEQTLAARGVLLQNINRGGLATAHEPGQLVAYPIVRPKRKDLRWFSRTLLETVVSLLADYDIQGQLKDGEPGVWVAGRKICSFGIALKKWISSHGIALNINNNLSTFDMIIPCGRPNEVVTSLAQELGYEVSMPELKRQFVEHFCRTFDYRPIAK